MNRFRTKKKVKENTEGIVRASTDSDAPTPTIKSSKTFRRGKKNPEPEPKPELDLANALPSSDDFRTSLLMSGLSARFSMLREQDDPNSKIGKASDDSVLFPRRQSKFNDLNFHSRGLADIAEVSSIHGSIKPPFAFSRADSYSTLDGDDEEPLSAGGMMNRAKPGESNNLFGGRQKISMGNRTLYDNDVSQSAFQKLRQQERELERLKREETEAQLSRPNSPPYSGYNRNRETSSTTSSGGPSLTRTSTAATSVASQRTPSLSGPHANNSNASGITSSQTSPVLDRAPKGRRLYETGLDNHLQEQQHSAMSRIDTLSRQRTMGTQSPPQAMSPTYAGDRPWDRKPMTGQASMPNLRAASPTPPGAVMGTFDFSIRQNPLAEKKGFGMASPPLSPPMSEYDDPAILAVQPNDRGKATALGTFNKPVQAYDEHKYSQRQLQMQQGRETPPLRKHSPPRAFAPRQQQQQFTNRPRAESNSTFASGSSRSNSSAQRNFPPQERIPENRRPQISVPEEQAISSGTFLMSSPDEGSVASPNLGSPDSNRMRGNPKPLDFSSMYYEDQHIQLERPPESQHPAHRANPFPEDWNKGVDSSNSSTTTFNLPPKADKVAPPADSPTLGPASGLSGMVRQHLRSDSGDSSVYGGVPSADFASRFPPDTQVPGPNDYSTKSNPWENDDWDQGYYGDNNYSQDNAANALNGGTVMPPPLTVRSPVSAGTPLGSSRAPWEREIDSHHRRDGSSETQKERQVFAEDLATRRKRVQDSLKEKARAESASRSASPAFSADFPRDISSIRSNPLGILKTKTSRSSLVGGSVVVKQRGDGQSKAMKMLGIGSATISSSPSPGKERFEENSYKQEEEPTTRGVTAPPTPPQVKAIRQARREAQRERERQTAIRYQQPKPAPEAGDSEWPSAYRNNPSRQEEQRTESPYYDHRIGTQAPSRERGPPPVTRMQRNHRVSQESKDSSGSNQSGSRPPSRISRDRSSSDASGGRSRSNQGRYRNDSRPEPAPSSSLGYYEDLQPPASARFHPKSPGTPNMGFHQSPMPSPMMGQGGRARSNSRAPIPAHLDSPKVSALQPSPEEIGVSSPRPSPPSPYVANPTPPLVHTQSQSGSNSSQGSQGSLPGHRKRSINKAEISEPRFISSTSRITTVNLPPGASLHNGADANAPPIPAVNPRRRQTRAMFNGLMGRKEEFEGLHSMPAATQSTEEMSTFSGDEEDKPRQRGKLRKSSSEGGNLNARARHIANATPSPAMPGTFPAGAGNPPARVEGGMF